MGIRRCTGGRQRSRYSVGSMGRVQGRERVTHAPGHLRALFQEWIEDGGYDAWSAGTDLAASVVGAEGEPIQEEDGYTVARLTGALWNCTDTMPASLCDSLSLPVGSS